MSITVVISCYKKDINWSNILKVDKIICYDHDDILPENKALLNNNVYVWNQIPNRGSEASAYLKYIIDNYDNLPDQLVLLHDEQYSWHHRGDIIELVNKNLKRSDPIINLNHYRWDGTNMSFYDKTTRFGRWYYDFLRPYLGDLPNDFMNGENGCAQFVINDTSLITQHPLKMYQDLYYGICMNEDEWDGVRFNGFEYFMEYTWHVILKNKGN
jgi:hypothetical protein